MCTYNGAAFLKEQLDSFSSQTRLPDELVVCDDCSKDATVKIIKEFAAAAPFPVRLHVNKSNLGTIKNFDRAVNACQGDVILLADQDDVWLPEKLGSFERMFESDKEIGLVFCDADLVNENLEPLNRRNWETVGFTAKLQKKFLDGNSFPILLYHNVISGCAMAFRAEYKNLILPLPEDLNLILHDHWTGILLSAVSKLGLINEPLVLYRQHPKQQVGARAAEIKEVLPTSFRSYFFRDLLGRFETKYSFDDILERLETVRRRIIPIADRSAICKATLDDIGGHITHLRSRTEIKKGIKQHLPIVIKELTTLRYHRYSNGVGSAIKDYFSRSKSTIN